MKLTAAAGVGGLWAAGDGSSVEVRDIRQGLRLTVTLHDLVGVVPELDVSTARFGRVCFSESGRLLFVLVERPATSQPGLSRFEDVVRIDTDTDAMSLFVTKPVATERAWLRASPLLHSNGRLYIGGDGGVHEWIARRNDLTGSINGLIHTQTGVSVTGLALDRVGGFVFAADSNGVLFRISIAAGSAVPIGNIGAGVSSLAFSEHYGGAANAGLYIGYEDGRVRFVSAASTRGTPPVNVVDYTSGSGAQMVSSGADGSLLIGDTQAVRRVIDDSDTRMGFEAWAADEIQQQVRFAKSLITGASDPGGAGWVIDGNVVPGGTLFHPATPDAAAWAVLLLLASHDLFGDPEALPLVRSVLQRYAGQLPGSAPSRTADGIYRHWIDPLTGNAKAGWDSEFATMSTMKLVAAAARGGNSFSGDAALVAAARSICCSVVNHSVYLNAANRAMYLKSLPGGGPDLASGLTPFHEGIMFVEQAAFYGAPLSGQLYDSWLNRSTLPSASYLSSRPLSSNFFGYQPSFVSLYPMLLVERYRLSPQWQSQIANVSSSAAAWTDDRSPPGRWFTVFSAGTTKPEWGGYHADTLTDSPGQVSTFTSLAALAGRADGQGVREATASYHAYRVGARQTFRGGSSILYRRSNVDPAWSPGDAGLPDVALGGLGLAEVVRPGFIDRVLIVGFPVCSVCRADLGRTGGAYGPDGVLNNNDFVVFVDAFFSGNMLVADVGATGGVNASDGRLDANDFVAFIDLFFSGCL